MALLGLLIDRPDSVAAISVRLKEEYPSAGWQRSIVYNTFRSLTEQGHIRRTKGGQTAAWHWYEATPHGEAYFAEWLRESAAEPPPMRDALLAKLKYVREPQQLASIVSDIVERERLTLEEHDALLSRYRRAHSAGQLTPRDSGDLQARVRAGSLTFELRELQARLRNLARFREDLEDPTGHRDTLEDG